MIKFNPDAGLNATPEEIKRMQLQLYSRVEPGGKNFSLAQTKLIQIGKAILQNPHLLLIDSTFFNVEVVYERLYHSLLFNNLPHTTIVCIEDRFEMLDHFDRVCVLEAGKIVDIGPPSELLHKGTSGHLGKLVFSRKHRNQLYLKKIVTGIQLINTLNPKK